MLSSHWRIVFRNALGQTIVTNGAKAVIRQFKIDVNGATTYEAAANTIAINSGGTITNGSYSAGATVDNSVNKYFGFDGYFEVTAPASSNGDVTAYFQSSPDGGTTWPDNGQGFVLGVLNFTTSGTKRMQIALD